MNNINQEMDKAFEAHGRHDKFNIGFKSGIAFAQRWIPVSAEMPTPDELVLVEFEICEGCTDITVLELSDDCVWHYRGNDFHSPKKIINWRPIHIKTL